MGGFTDLSLGMQFGVALGCLLALTFIAGFIKVVYNKRRTERMRIEEANRPVDEEKLVQRDFNEGNLFGVRAIQHGFYGGVAQSRPSSPAPSIMLAPEPEPVSVSKEVKLSSSASSINSVPRAQVKPSPLRLEVQDSKYNPSSVGGIGGSYMPPLPSPRSNKSASPMFNEPKPPGWVSPLDVHFSRPGTPSSSKPERPMSYLPKLNLDFGKNEMLMPANSEAKSAASAANREITTPEPAVLKSSTQSGFTSQLAAVRAAQKSLRSMYPADQQPVEMGSPRAAGSETPSVPLKNLSPRMMTAETGTFPQDNRQWNPNSPIIAQDATNDRSVRNVAPNGISNVPTDRWGFGSPTLGDSRMQSTWGPDSPTVSDAALDAEWDRSRPVIRDSTVSVQRVSVIRPTRVSQIESIANRDQRRRESFGASSMYSLETLILNENRAQHERMQSHTADFDFSLDKSNSKRASPTSSRNLTPTPVRHSPSMSDEFPMSLSTTQSGEKSVEHESPFSNSHATHSSSSSLSSYMSTTEAPALPENLAKSQPSLPNLENFPFPASNVPPPPRGFEFAMPSVPAEHLQISSGNRGRSTSEASQASIGDVYDSYYRQSGVGQASGRNSVQAQIQGFNSRTLGSGAVREPPKRPAPLNLSKLGQKYAGNETIVEVTTPNTGAFGPVGIERFPARI